SFTHHFEVTALYKQDPAAARNILEAAKYDLRPVSWVRERVQAFRARQATDGTGEAYPQTTAQKRRERVDALTLATTEQSEQDLALKGSPSKIEKAKRDELVALVEYAETNDLTPSDSVLRNIARLQAENAALREKVARLQAENDALRFEAQRRE